MANNSKTARRQAEYKRKYYYQNYLDRLTALFHNSVNVLNVDENDLPKRYLLRVLLNKGAIAYDKITGLYLPFVERGINVYGLPDDYQLVGYNGYIVDRKPEEVVILRANDIKTPLFDYFDIQINKLVDFDLAIEQNLTSVKTMTLIEVPDQATLMTLSNLSESRELGAAVAFVNKQANLDKVCKDMSTGAQYLVDKLQEARLQIWNETLNAIGISTANVEKRERVQEAEIQANDSYAQDCLNVLVDTFNFDAEHGGIPIRIEVNTTVIVDTEGDDNQDQEGEKE